MPTPTNPTPTPEPLTVAPVLTTAQAVALAQDIADYGGYDTRRLARYVLAVAPVVAALAERVAALETLANAANENGKKGVAQSADACAIAEQAEAIAGAMRAGIRRDLDALAAAVARQGEALGLRWPDIDLDRREMWVRFQLQRRPRGEAALVLDGNRGLVPTKSHRSRRTLVIPDALIEKLRAHRARQARERLLAGDQWMDHNLVFTTRKGSPLDGSEQTRRFRALVIEAGLPPRRFHDMRHSCGTILAAQDVPLSEIMVILGHSNIAVTMRYVHSLPETRRQAASRMNDALFGAGAS